ADGFLRPGGKIEPEILKPEGPEHIKGESQHPVDLLRHLVRAAEDMGVVLREPAYPEEAMENPAPFVTVNRAQFRPAEGEFPVGPPPALVGGDMERAVHRLDVVFLSLDLHGRIHDFTVKPQVPAGFPELPPAKMGRIDTLVTVLFMLLAPEILNHLANPAAFRMPENQAGADLFVGGEKV